MCFDGVKRLCHIRGKLRKKVWINQSDIVLIGLRDYQDAKADVILKYSADEARNLKSYGEFPESVKINETVDFVGGDLDDDIEFDDVDSEGSGSDEGDCLCQVRQWVLCHPLVQQVQASLEDLEDQFLHSCHQLQALPSYQVVHAVQWIQLFQGLLSSLAYQVIQFGPNLLACLWGQVVQVVLCLQIDLWDLKDRHFQACLFHQVDLVLP